jgi:hypothetical protein
MESTAEEFNGLWLKEIHLGKNKFCQLGIGDISNTESKITS